MAKPLSLSEVKPRLPELVAGVQEREKEVVVTKNGRPAVILINVDEYARLKETLDVLRDPALLNQINLARPSIGLARTGSRLRTCLVSHSLPSRSVALHESFPSGYPSACG
jgi:antitoxin YefM